MRSWSRWQAHGNVYLITDEPLAAEQVLGRVGDADGILAVTARGEDWLELAIWNPDGSAAGMSGNGTRIAAAWLAAQTGSRCVTVRVGPRSVVNRFESDGQIEQQLGPVVVGPAELLEGVRFVPVELGNPHAVVEGDPAEVGRIGPLLERHPRFPERTNVQVVRALGDGTVEARVWERGVGETDASGSSAIAIVAALGGGSRTVRFPGGELAVRIEGERAFLRGRAERVEDAAS